MILPDPETLRQLAGFTLCVALVLGVAFTPIVCAAALIRHFTRQD